MSKLADILIKQLAASGGGGTLRDQLASMKAKFGSNAAAARAAGVDRRTFGRILSGQTKNPKPTTVEKLVRAERDSRIRDAGLTAATLNLKFVYDGRERQVGASNLKLVDGTIEAMKSAYVAGDREGVARAFIDGVGDDWYHDLFEEIYDGYESDYGGEFVS